MTRFSDVHFLLAEEHQHFALIYFAKTGETTGSNSSCRGVPHPSEREIIQIRQAPHHADGFHLIYKKTMASQILSSMFALALFP
jgi:hypothetical protein